ncbi:Meiosis-specific protein ASY1 [Camellia lanceoleosa]|nr:Meiosis-specific protein ASY1 [Camellia lanceoleosa]
MVKESRNHHHNHIRSIFAKKNVSLPHNGFCAPQTPIFTVKSVLGPCEDENDDIQDDDVSLGADSVQRECSESNSEVPGLVNVDFADVRAIMENADLKKGAKEVQEKNEDRANTLIRRED